jgi:hypothetical protein
MTTRVRKDAMRQLRVVNEHQARDREGAEVRVVLRFDACPDSQNYLSTVSTSF